MYKELDKYRTGQKIKSKATLSKIGGGSELVEWEYDEYRAQMGDLIEDFIKHKTKPFWMRKINHSHVTKLYKNFLNEVEISIGL
jgi:hypothetical protein